MARNFESFVDGFVQYTANLPSSELWRRWAAIGTIAGVLERKTWTYTVGSNLYPNQYIWLVGPPGAGKTALTSVVQDLWYGLGTGPDAINVAPSSASGASFVDALRAGDKRIVKPNLFDRPAQYNTISAAINELGVLITAYDNELISLLTDLYDCKRYSERKRTSKLDFVIERPVVNMIACTTPSWLGEKLPDGAWDQGLMSRVVMVFTGTAGRPPLFGAIEADKSHFTKLVEDLKAINDIYGEMKFTKEAATAITTWYDNDSPPKPEHPKLESYNIRRPAKLLKLCQVACAATSATPVITLDHYQTALMWLLDAEAHMPDIFKSMTHGGTEQVAKELWFFCYNYLVKNGKKPVPESLVYEFLSKRLPPQTIKPLIEQLLAAQLFKRELDPKTREMLWKPRAKGGPTE